MKIKSLLILNLLILLCAGNLFGQEKNNQCKIFGNLDFIGEKISFNLKDTDLNDFLEQLENQIGCKFVVDKSVRPRFLTSEIKDVPWNIALKELLKSEGLDTENIAELTYIVRSKVLVETEQGSVLPNPPLYIDYIKLKRLLVVDSPIFCQYGNGIGDICSSKLVSLVKKMVSKQAAVIPNIKSNRLYIIETKEVLDDVLKKLETWDNSNLTIEEIARDFESKSKEQKLK